MTRNQYILYGALTGAGFGLFTGLLLPAAFVVSLVSSHLHASSLVAIIAAISAIYVPASIALGGWIGYHVAEKSREDAGFRFLGFVSDLVRGLFEQKAYRMLLVLTILFLLGGAAYKLYLLGTS